MNTTISLLIAILNSGGRVFIGQDEFNAIIVNGREVRLEREYEGLEWLIDVDAESLTIQPDGTYSFNDDDGDVVSFSVQWDAASETCTQDQITDALLAVSKNGGFSAVKATLRMAVANFVCEFKNTGDGELLEPDSDLLAELAEAIQTPVIHQT